MAKLSRLAQMVNRVRVTSGLTDKELSKKLGVSAQTVSNWKHGKIPRDSMIPQLAAFLDISHDMAGELIEEARISSGITKIPENAGVSVLGRGSESKIHLTDIPLGYARPNVNDTYAIIVDGAHAWINPNVQPREGHLVLIRLKGDGRLVKWPAELEAGEKVAGVVMLMELA